MGWLLKRFCGRLSADLTNRALNHFTRCLGAAREGSIETGDQVRDYILEQRIGAGGVGEVWRARHIRLNKPVAIKLILPHLCQDENIYSRFVQEAIATANLRGILTSSAFTISFPVGDDAFLVMSYIEGGSLQDRIRKAPWPAVRVRCAAHRGWHPLGALDFAHQRGIVPPRCQTVEHSA